SVGPDTGLVAPRPRTAAEAVRRAREEAARVAKQTEVARAVSGGVLPRIQVDTPMAIPRSLIRGAVRASGTITGSIARFNLQGAANGTGLLVRGNAARHLVSTYSWTDAFTPQSRGSVTRRGDTISTAGFAFDSLAAELSYRKPNGSVGIRVRQNNEQDYTLNGEFTLDKQR